MIFCGFVYKQPRYPIRLIGSPWYLSNALESRLTTTLSDDTSRQSPDDTGGRRPNVLTYRVYASHWMWYIMLHGTTQVNIPIARTKGLCFHPRTCWPGSSRFAPSTPGGKRDGVVAPAKPPEGAVEVVWIRRTPDSHFEEGAASPDTLRRAAPLSGTHRAVPAGCMRPGPEPFM